MVLRPLGTSASLGLVGLAVATSLYAGFQLGWVSESERTIVGVLLIAFPVPLQLAASLLAFMSRDGAAGTAMGILGVTWLSSGLTLLVSARGSTSHALGLLLFGAAAALTLSAASTGLSKLVPAAVFATAALRFGLEGVYALSAAKGWEDASAAVGLALALLALYAAWAFELEDARGRSVLPLGRRGVGKRALEGPLEEQVEGVANEAGVRKRL